MFCQQGVYSRRKTRIPYWRTHYYLDGYGDVLEANGYLKYQYPVDLSDYEQKYAFEKTEDSKYAECYINQDNNCAIKFYWSIYNGNTIRVFKLDEMRSWNVDDVD